MESGKKVLAQDMNGTVEPTPTTNFDSTQNFEPTKSFEPAGEQMDRVSTNFIGPENIQEQAGAEITKDATSAPKRHRKGTRKEPTPIVGDEVRRIHRIEGFQNIQLTDTQWQ